MHPLISHDALGAEVSGGEQIALEDGWCVVWLCVYMCVSVYEAGDSLRTEPTLMHGV